MLMRLLKDTPAKTGRRYNEAAVKANLEARPKMQAGAGRAAIGKPAMGIRSVSCALAILLDVARNPRPQGFAEFQKRHKLPKATLHKLLATLEAQNFLRKNEETGKYSLGLAALEVSANAVANPEDLGGMLDPILQKLVQDWKETCHLAIIHDNEEFMIKRLDPPDQMVRLATLIGRRHPPHATAGGLASLALQLENSLLPPLPEKLPQLTKNTIKTRDELLKRLEEIREKGYAIELEEAYIGVRCVGVAVAVPGWPIVNLSFSLPLQRASVERLTTLAKPLKASAKEIEKILLATRCGS